MSLYVCIADFFSSGIFFFRVSFRLPRCGVTSLFPNLLRYKNFVRLVYRFLLFIAFLCFIFMA
ncbi:hypothetical protein HDV64DRAFT_49204 [Trichoderma sp. TUCIM 5745]